MTGGHGFLGKVLVRTLEREGHAITLAKGDLSRSECLFDQVRVDFVFHLAGKTGVRQSWQNPLLFYQANVDTTRHVLEYCRLHQAPMHYVSAYVYGDQGAIPIAETALARPDSPYAHSKWLGEEMCRFYGRSFALPITISRPFNIYGPSQSADFFIPRMVAQVQNSPEINVLSLNARRDYVFVEDVAEALLCIMKRGKSGEVYNIGSGRSFSCQEVIEELQRLAHTSKPVVAAIAGTELLHAQAQIEKIRLETGWELRHSLREGLSKCL